MEISKSLLPWDGMLKLETNFLLQPIKAKLFRFREDVREMLVSGVGVALDCAESVSA